MTTNVIVGRGLLASALGDLYLFLKSSVHSQELEQVLCDIELKADLDILQALLDDLAQQKECRIVKVTSDQLKLTVDQIRANLQGIQNELEAHKHRYFKSWRSPDYTTFILKLCDCRNNLRKQRDLLISVFNVQKNIKEFDYSQSLHNQVREKNFIERFLE